MNDDTTRASGRRQLLVIAGIALASLGGAYLLFGLASGGGVWRTTNQGTFVEPPTTVADLGIRDTAGGTPEQGVWWLWVAADGDCAAACRDALERMRQVHALLNRDAPRVRRALVNGGADAAEIAGDFPRLALLSGNLADLASGIYVVDPLGNLVFHYPLTDAGDPVLDDLKRLLKVSQIG